MFRINRPIQPNGWLSSEDVVRTNIALSSLGFYSGNLHRIPDDEMFDGITAFQRQAGLVPDGIINPNGPTVRMLSSFVRGGPRHDDPSGPKSNAASFSSVVSVATAVATVNAAVVANALVGVSAAVVAVVAGHGRKRRPGIV